MHPHISDVVAIMTAWVVNKHKLSRTMTRSDNGYQVDIYDLALEEMSHE